MHRRYRLLPHPLVSSLTDWGCGLMRASRCYNYTGGAQGGAVLVSQRGNLGTLLDLVNITKLSPDKSITEPVALSLLADILGKSNRNSNISLTKI